MTRLLIKLIGIISILSILTGCDSMYGTHHSAQFCKNNGYKGMIISENSLAIYCSNGEKSQRACWITLDGEKCDKKIVHFYFLTFGN